MKNSVYDIVTKRIVQGLKKGRIPWKRKWAGGGLPMNYASKRYYQGINRLLLAINAFESPYYLTFNQVKKLGGTIKKNSRAEMVVFWKVYEKTRRVKDKETGNTDLKKDKRFVLRYYNVFNAEQIEGIHIPDPETFTHTPIEQAEAIWQEYIDRPERKKGGPSYNPLTDVIKIPARERFKTASLNRSAGNGGYTAMI